MPKVTISLKPIVQQIEAIQGELSNAAVKALTPQDKQKAKNKIKQLQAVIKDVKQICPKGKSGYGIVVPTT